MGILFPPRCPFCDEVVPMGKDRICDFCIRKIELIKEPYCLKCGKKLANASVEYCLDCLKYSHEFDAGRSLLGYKGVVRKSLYRFKYSGRAEYAKAYAMLAERELGEFVRKVAPDAFVPVPLHPKRYKKRGYNQAELFAQELSRIFDIPVRSGYVRRIRNTIPLKTLERVERQNNLKKAFKINENDVKLNTIIVVDDIYTTGSTMDALSYVMRQAGVSKIFFLTISGGK